MSPEPAESVTFSRWIARPQSIIALSALLLSVCGVFIALYEAALIRQQQRASVWPHVEVAASMNGQQIELWVRNVGVGPARVIAAAVSRRGEVRAGWAELLQAVSDEPRSLNAYYSVIDGRVLPRDSEREVVLRLTENSGPGALEVVERLSREILDSEIDLVVCYCSVFDECWTSSIQDTFARSQGAPRSDADRRVDDCDAAARSAI